LKRDKKNNSKPIFNIDGNDTENHKLNRSCTDTPPGTKSGTYL